MKQTQSTIASEPLLKVLFQLCELYAVYWLLNNLGDFLMVLKIEFFLISVHINVEFHHVVCFVTSIQI